MSPVELGMSTPPAPPASRRREADLGVSAGNGKGQIFLHGQVITTLPEHRIVQTLLHEARQRDWSQPPTEPPDQNSTPR